MAKYIPVGIYNNELFMVENVEHTDCLGHLCFDVIRPVSKSQLEYLQSDKYNIDVCDELWREKVRHDMDYTDGLSDFVEMVKMEQTCGDEEWLFKDSSFCDVLEDERKIYQPLDEWQGYLFDDDDLSDRIDTGDPLSLREFVDAHVEYNTGEAVGSWEASGGYPPESGRNQYAKFDVVLNEEVANIWYKQANLI